MPASAFVCLEKRFLRDLLTITARSSVEGYVGPSYVGHGVERVEHARWRAPWLIRSRWPSPRRPRHQSRHSGLDFRLPASAVGLPRSSRRSVLRGLQRAQARLHGPRANYSMVAATSLSNLRSRRHAASPCRNLSPAYVNFPPRKSSRTILHSLVSSSFDTGTVCM